MNRWEEIKTAAFDVAQHVTQDPAQREAMAGDLITLIGLMMSAVGKCVAVEGVADMNGVSDLEFAKAHAMYLIGEQVQSQADYVVREAKTAEAYICCDKPYGSDCKDDPFKTSATSDGPLRVSTVVCGATPDGPACDWDPDCPVHGWFGLFGR